MTSRRADAYNEIHPRTIVDPPSGWRYGFPKALPDNRPADWNFRGWLIENGYPESEVDFGMIYCRQWEQPDDRLVNAVKEITEQ